MTRADQNSSPPESPPAGLVVAYQGEPGAYSELAAIEHFGRQISPLPCPTFDIVFKTVSQGRAARGLVPVENSLAGSIHQNYDLLLRNDLSIVGEHHLRVSHCLLALPGVRLEEIQVVHSHPQALAQCAGNLTRLGLTPVAEADTAGSARLIRERQARGAAALASRRAAEVYELSVLIENMEDNPANYTRFLALADQALAAASPEKPGYKTAVVFSLQNKPGELFKALSVFALRDIDLTKIESRPIPGKPWEYMFYVDFEGHAEAPVCAKALDHLDELTTFQRILGSFQRHSMGAEKLE